MVEILAVANYKAFVRSVTYTNCNPKPSTLSALKVHTKPNTLQEIEAPRTFLVQEGTVQYRDWQILYNSHEITDTHPNNAYFITVHTCIQ